MRNVLIITDIIRVEAIVGCRANMLGNSVWLIELVSNGIDRKVWTRVIVITISDFQIKKETPNKSF